jgi:hypothetical protein
LVEALRRGMGELEGQLVDGRRQRDLGAEERGREAARQLEAVKEDARAREARILSDLAIL